MYHPRGMPARYMEGAPSIVRKSIIDIIGPFKDAVCEFDVCFRDPVTDDASEFAGLDFGADGSRGCHFFLKRHELRAFRERNRRKRVAWAKLPAPTRAAILNYLESDND